MTVRNTQHPQGNGLTTEERVQHAEARVAAAKKMCETSPASTIYKLALAAREKELADLRRALGI